MRTIEGKLDVCEFFRVQNVWWIHNGNYSVGLHIKLIQKISSSICIYWVLLVPKLRTET